jgi:hypothetical protein
MQRYLMTALIAALLPAAAMAQTSSPAPEAALQIAEAQGSPWGIGVGVSSHIYAGDDTRVLPF